MIYRENYLLVKKFLRYQDEVMQRDPLTIDHLERWLKHLLRWADDATFASAPDIRPVFPQYLKAAVSNRGQPLCANGIQRGCQDARRFFQWLLQHYRGQFKAITPVWIDTLQPPRINGILPRSREVVTLEMVRKLLKVDHDPDDLALRRDKAAAAFLFLSGIRATAFCTLPLTCVNVSERVIQQFPNLGVRTKNRKAIVTHLLEIPDLLAVCTDWDAFVRSRLPPSAMWYSVIDISCGTQVWLSRL